VIIINIDVIIDLVSRKRERKKGRNTDSGCVGVSIDVICVHIFSYMLISLWVITKCEHLEEYLKVISADSWKSDGFTFL